ncbi:hypothetical protein EVAR_32117_1 [Eumeta japonica]|uniref:Uncharacterized protein n=1 Tax=Eumeta variegata TaxID=151549 RepID=A0A4C1V4V5_EUMVA|nr:hypothetical protein EVAR_32117_1 [Eumeta japonica]
MQHKFGAIRVRIFPTESAYTFETGIAFLHSPAKRWRYSSRYCNPEVSQHNSTRIALSVDFLSALPSRGRPADLPMSSPLHANKKPRSHHHAAGVRRARPVPVDGAAAAPSKLCDRA